MQTDVFMYDFSSRTANLDFYCIFRPLLQRHPELYALYEESGDKDVLEMIKKISTIAWRHINMGGRYEFSTIIEMLNVNDILKKVVFGTTRK